MSCCTKKTTKPGVHIINPSFLFSSGQILGKYCLPRGRILHYHVGALWRSCLHGSKLTLKYLKSILTFFETYFPPLIGTKLYNMCSFRSSFFLI